MKYSYMIGSLKVWQTRLAGYISMINFVMIFYLYIMNTPLDLLWWQWTIIVIGICIAILYVDIKYIFPNSNIYGFRKNPEFMEFKQDIKHIKEILKNMETSDIND